MALRFLRAIPSAATGSVLATLAALTVVSTTCSPSASPSFASMRICAADGSEQLLTSSPASVMREAPPAPLTPVLKSLMAKSVGAQAA